MPHARLDHLVITAASLEAGVDYVRERLGVAPQPGGKHPRMGTHNCLLKLGPATYLEVIAIDPEASVPYVPRWFRLDQSGELAPRLATWVARTDAIQAAAAASPAFGRIEPMERGALRWEITLPEQGGLPFDGIAPTLIQWLTQPHPAALMPDCGCTLVGLEGFHAQPEAVSSLLQAIGFQDEFKILPLPEQDQPRLIAHIQTPTGLRSIG